MSALYRIVEGLYWLGLGTWAGTLVAIAVAAPTVFETVRAHEPRLEAGPYARPALAADAPDILAGGIVGHVVARLERVQWVCATVVLAALVLECGPFRRRLARGIASPANVMRVALIAVALGAATAHVVWAEPAVWRLRKQMYGPDVSAAARTSIERRFAWYHETSERLLAGQLLLVAAAGLVTPFARGRADPPRLSPG